MPYNLRKRKVPEVVQDSPKRIKKEPAKKTKKDSPKRIQEDCPERIEVDSPKRIEKVSTKKVEKDSTKKIKKESTKRIKKDSPVEEAPEQIEEEAPKKIEEDATKKIKIDHESNLLAFGSDTCGELGLKKIGCTRKTPTLVALGEPASQVVCGPMHTLVLTKSGSIYSFGCNDEGALGRETDGDETLEATPTIIDLSKNVIKITAGDSHGAALTADHKVFIWGNFRDEHGSVGLTPECDGQSTYKPVQVLAEKKLVDIASGSNHMLLLDKEGVVYSFGVGAQGQLGRYEPKKDSKSEDAITSENREFFLTPQVVSLKNVDPQRPFVCDAIYAGNFSSFATNTDKKKNRLAGWGLNNYFQLGYKGLKGQLVQYYPKRSTFTCATSMISVSCGQHHTIFLTKTGRVYVAGRNEYGMLGVGKDMEGKKEVCPAKCIEGFNSPIQSISAGINTSFAVSQEGKLYSWGMNGPNLGIDSGDDDLTEPTLVKSLDKSVVKRVATGGSFTAVITN